eukprot:TRINITY_DN277_c1_g2_i1.p1 TRINITY_DN277_c1_g2~~TRINITY_DN277_c1_g2_i1.p1  ORF type:complete len:468 (+),score=146.52 TRINITY_DN277_c1_g2_i1:88-1491(+)
MLSINVKKSKKASRRTKLQKQLGSNIVKPKAPTVNEHTIASYNADPSQNEFTIPVPKPAFQVKASDIVPKKNKLTDKEQAALDSLIKDKDNKSGNDEEDMDITIELKDQVEDKEVPTLLRNVPPAARDAANPKEALNEKLKYDTEPVSVSADDRLDESVFAKAWLRGQGWKGQDDVSSYKAVGRDARAGLGSKKNPFEKERKSRTKEQNKTPQIVMKPNMLIRIGPGKFAGRMAIVRKVEGVPGLDKMEVYVKKDGLFLARKSDAVLITKHDREGRKDLIEEYDNLLAEYTEAVKRWVKEERKKRREEKMNKRKQQQDDDNNNNNNSMIEQNPPAPKRKRESKEVSSSRSSAPTRACKWAREGIRVVVADASLSIFKKKANIIRISSSKPRVDLELDSGDKKYSILETALETYIPHTGDKVMILVRSRKGEKGEIIEKNRDSETVLVRFSNREKKTYSFDEVSGLAR